ncbi:MAG: hypothetical protein DYG92_14730 [Leptolyngbya sp. PLA1]|nr:hypothetical protein [Leptolyngbya sp. PLA1]
MLMGASLGDGESIAMGARAERGTLLDVRTWLLAVVVAAAGCQKPCDPIAESPTARRLGVVLDGGRVCKEDNLVVTVEYPDRKREELAGAYASALEKAGWKAEQVSPATVLATRDADTVFVVTGKDEKTRRVPFAVVRHCSDPRCRIMLEELAAELKQSKQ